MTTAPHDVVSVEQQQALDVVRKMIEAGVPVFAAPPCPAASGGVCDRPGHGGGREEFDLPRQWQKTVPSAVWLDRWQPGWALAAVGGHVADFLDVDTHHGGGASVDVLAGAGHLPQVYGVSETPSGGQHLTIAPLHERKACPAAPDLPGLDYQGGAEGGEGRGFVWLPPTVKRSKNVETMGELRPYRWLQEPDLEWLTDGGDESGDMLRTRVVAARAARLPAVREHDLRAVREFTEGEARSFCEITLARVEAAQIGGIEEAANAAAAQLSHFVPDFWSEGFAYAVLEAALAKTAYDAGGPSSWTAEKFHAVLNGEGGRAPLDWKAVRRAESVEQAVAEAPADEVEALLAEMLTPEQMMARPPKPYLIKELLHLDSLAWLIGAPGAGKSFVALDIAGHVSMGRDWQGLKTKQGAVLIIAAEGAGGFGSRLKAWEKQHGPLAGGAPITVLPRPVQAGNLAAWAVLVRAAARLDPPPSLVLLDTQARVTVGLKENDATDMGVFVDAATALMAATKACVMPLHHTGRAGGDARGSSALDGAQDTELKVVAGAAPLRGELRVEKQKDLAERDPIPLLFKIHTVDVDEDGDPVSSLALAGTDAWLALEVAPEQVVPGQEKDVPEPEAWTWLLVDHNRRHTQRQILQVLASVAGQIGITEAAARAVVLARWYDGRPMKAKRKGYLDPATWQDSWTTVRALKAASGDSVLVNEHHAERWAINPEILSGLG